MPGEAGPRLSQTPLGTLVDGDDPLVRVEEVNLERRRRVIGLGPVHDEVGEVSKSSILGRWRKCSASSTASGVEAEVVAEELARFVIDPFEVEPEEVAGCDPLPDEVDRGVDSLAVRLYERAFHDPIVRPRAARHADGEARSGRTLGGDGPR